MTTAKRQLTERQLAALVKAREALVKKHTYECCGWEDPTRGLLKQGQDQISTTPHNRVAHHDRVAGWSFEEVAYYLGHITASETPAITTCVQLQRREQ